MLCKKKERGLKGYRVHCMITDSFDDKTEAIISPGSFFGDKRYICDTAIGTFSREIYAEVLNTYPNEQIDEIRAANWVRPVHLIKAGGMNIVFYLSLIGAVGAATDVIELNWKTGADKFIMFGSAGALDKEGTAGKYIIPTHAYRDEGMSYHYAPAADYIKVGNSGWMEEFFKKAGLPYATGRVWTTDAFYRETRGHVAKRKEEGCVAVEMELAGLQAVCDYHGFELYDFLVTGDIVDQPDYTPEGLHEANHSLDKFYIAVKIAKELHKKQYGFYGAEASDIKDEKGLTPRDYYDILKEAWCKETCAPRMRDRWSTDNVTLGQCSITSFLMQDIYGGKVFGIPLPDGNYHCFNDVDGCIFDLTSEQFGDRKLDYRNVYEQSREKHFLSAEKRERYEILKKKVMKAREEL